MRRTLLLAATIFFTPLVFAEESISPSLDLSWATRIQKQVDSLTNTIQKDVRIPTGTIVSYYGDKAPKGWMLCDGSTVPSDFEELRKVVGERVPDLRGMFLRGANNARSDGNGDAEIGRAIGSFQNDMIRKHSHSLSLQGAAGNNAFVPRDPAWGYDDWHGPARQATTTEQGGDETRPKNVAVNFIIKI